MPFLGMRVGVPEIAQPIHVFIMLYDLPINYRSLKRLDEQKTF